jgi:3-oxoacyl-[acyl-carrier protein] reductase
VSDRPVALVTGAARGIGAACARALAREGFRVAVHCNASVAGAEKLAAELPDAFALRADLADAA